MFDINVKQPERPTIEVADYIELGKLMVEWTRDPTSRPTSVAELARQLAGIAVIPRRVKRIAFVQNDEETLYVRLPEEALLGERVEEMMDDCSGRLYRMPYFYRDFFDPGFGPVMSSYETLLARLGDSMAAQS
ncbi:hypothetical protein [Amaricoccus solimangrovi]|uniref:Uncharacterized protein n=1 Tax=Amaricoccus solimangrovi TaxID=2589815 RepID=A0A501WSZ2_9RHOB|nr:hypothetical protein [Amaricoccus solimangrovi]TPE52539.1 hypothetical protein FJM51_04990 [Amaricoccus solimangrovi]